MPKFIYTAKLPSAPSCVESREIALTKNGDRKLITVKKNVKEYRIIADSGDNISLTVTDITKEGQRSEESDALTFLVDGGNILGKPAKPSMGSVEKVSNI